MSCVGGKISKAALLQKRERIIIDIVGSRGDIQKGSPVLDFAGKVPCV